MHVSEAQILMIVYKSISRNNRSRLLCKHTSRCCGGPKDLADTPCRAEHPKTLHGAFSGCRGVGGALCISDFPFGPLKLYRPQVCIESLLLAKQRGAGADV